ncbi:MAG: 3-hydroxyacyl-CoA dehydrogenase NAD-binding domain-containing protein [Pseudomonadota bacterium]
MTDIFTMDVQDGIATITWDLPGASMNILNEPGVRQLDTLVDQAIADESVKGVILTSGKADFAAGMDLNVIAETKARAAASGGHTPEAIFNQLMEMHGVLRKIERAGADPKTNKGGKPFVWAAPGTALGIGLELGLACHYRVAADNPKAKIGLPEILVGIFPGMGGTTRLIRMLGLMGSAEALLQGKTYEPKKAKALMLIDKVVPAEDLISEAREWLNNASEKNAVKPWDEKGFKIPGGGPYHPKGFEMFLGGVVMTHGKTQGVYPAAKAMLSAAYEGAMVPFDAAIRIEARWFTNVLMNPSSEAMIRSLFINKQALEKGAVRPAGVPDMSVKKVGVLGAGMMGAGIAYVSANAGIEVVLLDRDLEAAEKGKAYSEGILDKGMKRKKVTEEKKAEVLGRIQTTADYADLEGCDLIVEAVFEDPAIKAAVTEATEAMIPEDAIFASNTSTLPITDLAKASKRPDRFIGIHFFSPVDKMLLVEIIKGKETGDEAVAKSLDFVRQIRKTPIVVNDARFFYANRCIIPYIYEGLRMVTEGVNPALIENAAKQMGMPLGPLQLTDETSLELGYKIAKATEEAMGDTYPRSGADDLLEEMVAKRGRMGRKSGAGLYSYRQDGKRDGLWQGLGELWPVVDEQPDLEDVQNRLMMAQTLEAVRALEEGVLEDIREGDVGAILGWGFAPWSGGPLSWLDMMGAAKAKEICDDLAARFGERFTTPALLADMAAKEEHFYGRFAPAKAA